MINDSFDEKNSGNVSSGEVSPRDIEINMFGKQSSKFGADLADVTDNDDGQGDVSATQLIHEGSGVADFEYAFQGHSDKKDIFSEMQHRPSNDQKLALQGQNSKSQVLGQSSMRKSQSGFDIGGVKSVGSFFSNMRQKALGEEPNFFDTEKMNGREFVRKLAEQQQDRYQKKYPFERGMYHQCIPNPDPTKKDSFITAQLITRALGVMGQQETAGGLNEFSGDQDVQKKEFNSTSQQFMRYNLVPPSSDADGGANGEGEGDDDTSNQGMRKSVMMDQSDHDNSALYHRGQTHYAGDAINQELYKQQALYEEIDNLYGIDSEPYADIAQSKSQRLIRRAYMGCSEFAVIAFWDMEPETEKYVCTRYFIVPNPQTRVYDENEGTSIRQVLYTSQTTKDVFFFFKGHDLSNNDLGDEYAEPKLQIGFLNLTITEEEMSDLGDFRHLGFHCKDTNLVDENSVLGDFITKMHKCKFEEQKQLPNPTVINAVGREASDDYGSNKLVVFTSYMAEEIWSKGELMEGEYNGLSENWYPTVFFYDLLNDKVDWEIFGAELFINIDGFRKATVLMNEIWWEVDKAEYELKMQEEDDFSRHKEFYNYITKIRYNTSPSEDQVNGRAERAPRAPNLGNYKLVFGVNKGLEITEDAKIVEGYMHNGGTRVSLIYQGIGSFSFDMSKATSLDQPNAWNGKYGKRSFRADLTYSARTKTLRGQGKDDNDVRVQVELQLEPQMDQPWIGYYETGEEVVPLFFSSLNINIARQSISGEVNQDEGSTIQGSTGKKDKATRRRHVEFTVSMEDGDKTFIGQMDITESKIYGNWSSEENEQGGTFSISLGEPVPGVLSLKFDDSDLIEGEKIQIDFQEKEIHQAPGEEPVISEFYAIDAVDTADLVYFINKPDVGFLQTDFDTFVVAKLGATSDDDANGNGKGVCDASLVLYKISAIKKKKNKDGKKDGKKKIAQEPKERSTVQFYLNQSYLQCQENKLVQLSHLSTCAITSSNRFVGSIIYEESGSDELVLNFVTAQVNPVGEVEPDYPQSPCQQSWIVDYPLLAYKTYTPKNREIAIVHMALDMPQRIIHLGEWEFVCFVNHTQMIEQRLFDKDKETNCDIMFLVRREGKIRLMSFKSNPWLQFNEAPNGADPDVCKQSLFIFSGSLEQMPNEDVDGNVLERTPENLKRFGRRFNNDKIQCAQLISKRYGNSQSMMMILQFNDCIVQASLNKNKFKVICKPEAMLRRHIVRGYNEKIFYAETVGNAEKIFQLEMHGTKPNDTTKKEIFQLAGSWLVAIEACGENIQNDTDDSKLVTQALYIMDDQQKIYVLRNEDTIRFEVTKVIDFSHHDKLKKVTELRDEEWAHVHVTQRTLTFGETTYNLNSDLSFDTQVPSNFFGQDKRASNDDDDEEEEENDSDDDDQGKAKDKNSDEGMWVFQRVSNMDMTTNMISQCQRNHTEFCFVVKPAPGSRKVNIVGFQQLHEITQMLFVSNTHVLLKFRGGKAVVLLVNGSIISQKEARIQSYLEENSRVVGESQIYKGNKTVLLEQSYGTDLAKKRHITLQFDTFGIASVIGIYDEYTQQSQDLINQMKTANAHLASETTQQMAARKVAEAADVAVDGFQEKKAMKVKYTKEFFITEKGEVIKIAAMITNNHAIRAELQGDERLGEDTTEVGQKKSAKKKKKVETGFKAPTHLTILKMKNTYQGYSEDGTKIKSEFKVLVFHCRDKSHLTQLTKGTQYCTAGDYICQRNRERQVVWITRLKELGQGFITPTDFTQEASRKYDSKALNLSDLINRQNIEHLQMTEVPEAFFSNVSKRVGKSMEFYHNMFQVTLKGHGIIFDLDDKKFKEVTSIENIEQLQDVDNLVDTGFIMSSSEYFTKNDVEQIRRTQIFSNEYVNLTFRKIQVRKPNGKRKFDISGMLNRSFSEIDLNELIQITESLESRTKINDIDPQSIICTYEGHTIFSIFFDSIAVYEKILQQLDATDFEPIEDDEGNEMENPYLRRLYRVLYLPTSDFFPAKMTKKQREEELERQQALADQVINENCCTRSIKYLRRKLGIGSGEATMGDVGFKSIQKKSLHFTSARYRESLMEIAMLCAENSVNNFVDNLQDIKILFKSLSPAVLEFFENGFNETRFTRKIKNLDWKIGDNLQVIGQMNSAISEKQANKLVTNGAKTDSDKFQNRQVNAKVLEIDFIFEAIEGQDEVGFRELVVALANAPHESLFSTELIITLVDHFWDRYFQAIVVRCFIPFLVYFALSVTYFSIFAVKGISEDEQVAMTTEFIMRVLIFLFTVYFMVFDVIVALREGIGYVLDIFNYIDVASFSLNFYLLWTTTTFNLEERATDTESDTTIRALAAFATVLMYFKGFYWMRLFGSTSFYVRLIKETLYDIRYFLILFVAILLTFGNALMILNEQRGDASVIDNFLGNTFMSAILNQYMLSLGEFALDNFDSDGGDLLVWGIFIVTTFITNITFLNMLIAIMGDTFARVSEIKDQSALVEKIRILSDYVIVVRRESEERGDLSRFIYAISPKSLGQDEAGSWEGTVTQLKKAIDGSMSQIKTQLNKKVGSVSNEVSAVNAKLGALDDKMNELQGSQSKLPQMKDLEKIFRNIALDIVQGKVVEEVHAEDMDEIQDDQQKLSIRGALGGGLASALGHRP